MVGRVREEKELEEKKSEKRGSVERILNVRKDRKVAEGGAP